MVNLPFHVVIFFSFYVCYCYDRVTMSHESKF